MARVLKKRSEVVAAAGTGQSHVAAEDEGFTGAVANGTAGPSVPARLEGGERLPDGRINNCSLANSAPEAECQVCKGTCPDRAVFAGERRPAPLPPKPFMFESAHGDEEHPISPGFERLVERTFTDDPEREYDELERDMVIGERRGDRGTVQEHLDRAASNTRRAFRLWRTAQLVAKEWESSNRAVFASMRSEAHAELQASRGTKVVSGEAVEDMMASMYPEKHGALSVRRLKIHSLERNCENLYETWRERCRDLIALASLIR